VRTLAAAAGVAQPARMGARSTTSRLIAAMAVSALALTTASCGDDDGDGGGERGQVDVAAVERQIEQGLSTANAKVDSVGCPSEVQSETGGTFRCSVTWTNDAKGEVEVAQESRTQFDVEVVPGSVEVPGSEVEDELERALAQDGFSGATVSCPETVTVELDTTVTCNATGAGGQAGGTVSFSFSSSEGTVDASSVESS
jgi:hypothetical protein